MFFKDYFKMDKDKLLHYAEELRKESEQKRQRGELEESCILKRIEEKVRIRASLI